MNKQYNIKMEIQDFKLTNATMELLFNYLIDKPYKEVVQIISKMQEDIQNCNKEELIEDKKEN